MLKSLAVTSLAVLGTEISAHTTAAEELANAEAPSEETDNPKLTKEELDRATEPRVDLSELASTKNYTSGSVGYIVKAYNAPKLFPARSFLLNSPLAPIWKFDEGTLPQYWTKSEKPSREGGTNVTIGFHEYPIRHLKPHQIENLIVRVNNDQRSRKLIFNDPKINYEVILNGANLELELGKGTTTFVHAADSQQRNELTIKGTGRVVILGPGASKLNSIARLRRTAADLQERVPLESLESAGLENLDLPVAKVTRDTDKPLVAEGVYKTVIEYKAGKVIRQEEFRQPPPEQTFPVAPAPPEPADAEQ